MAAETGHDPNRIYHDQSGNLHLNGASLFDANEVDQKNSLAAAVATPVAGVAAGYKIARGVLTTVTASDTVVTGLATVVAVVVSMGDDPSADPAFASATVGDQAGAPAAGSVLVKTWKPTTPGAAGNPTPIAATTFAKKVNWIASGT